MKVPSPRYLCDIGNISPFQCQDGTVDRGTGRASGQPGAGLSMAVHCEK